MKPTTASRPAMLVSSALLALSAAGPAMAQSTSPAQGLLDDRFVFNLGAFIFQTDITARLDGQSATNPEVDFDKTFGKPKNANKVRADVLWRITPTHHARLMYFNNNQSRSRTLAEEIKWGDVTFPAGSTVRSDTKYSITELAYEYAFMRRPSYEVAATFGVHYTDISLTLSGAANSREASTPAPLPVIGLRAGWVVAPQWYVDAQAQFFKANVGGVDGSITDLRVGATWMFSRNYGVGMGYNRFSTKVDVAKDTFDGRLRFGYSGLQAYVTGTY